MLEKKSFFTDFLFQFILVDVKVFSKNYFNNSKTKITHVFITFLVIFLLKSWLQHHKNVLYFVNIDYKTCFLIKIFCKEFVETLSTKWMYISIQQYDIGWFFQHFASQVELNSQNRGEHYGKIFQKGSLFSWPKSSKFFC